MPPPGAVMDRNVAQDWISSDSHRRMHVLTNSTSITRTHDGTNAVLYMMVVIGFFAFIMVSSMVINQLLGEAQEEDLLADILTNQSRKKKKSIKLCPRNPLCFINRRCSDTATSKQDSQRDFGPVNTSKNTQTETKKPASGSTSARVQPSEAFICVATIS